MAEATKKPAKKAAAKKAETPEPTESKAVEVSPEDPKQDAVEVSPKEAPTATFFGKEYVVTEDGGHRLKS